MNEYDGRYDAQRADGLSILYLDEHLVAVNKPSGLLVHRGYARDAVVLLDQVSDFLGQKSYSLHRLDRGMIFFFKQK
ncbi:MAG: hypothetical protein KC609_13325, partial [Myxococcales bacterium]|nr:hypothetical protein [Myxococcales bacterium]